MMIFLSRELKTKKERSRNSRTKKHIYEIKKKKSLDGINIRLETIE